MEITPGMLRDWAAIAIIMDRPTEAKRYLILADQIEKLLEKLNGN